MTKLSSRASKAKQWMKKHSNDPFVSRRGADGYIARSAYKLIEIDDRYKIIGKTSKIVDLGAAPGGWSQVISERACKSNHLYAVDLLPMRVKTRVKYIGHDFLKINDDIMMQIPDTLDLVLSDMSPNLSGDHASDHIRIIELNYAALEFSIQKLSLNGSFLFKTFMGPDTKDLVKVAKKSFLTCTCIKPQASRKSSSEVYYLCRKKKHDS